MEKSRTDQPDADKRMRGYLGKIATGPRMSKDLTGEEAEDALSLILTGAVSPVRAGIFLIAARMKLETVEENIGYWRALEKTTVRHSVPFDRLLQVADPFDGFNRVPYFGFYTLPVLAAMGLPAYGHSSLPLPPKFGITFEDLLVNHYRIEEENDGEKRLALLRETGFGFLSTRHSNPELEQLRQMRVEIVKRPMLATLEKMLMPLKARSNFLATGYFHKGYEVSMMAVARLSEFDKTVIGNGVEGSTLYGVHKPARVFIDSGQAAAEERSLKLETLFDPETAREIQSTYQDLKNEGVKLDRLAEWGEDALAHDRGPAAPLIACHAATLLHLLGLIATAQEGYETARDVMRKGEAQRKLMRYLEGLR